MVRQKIAVRVPATTANLGPGFDTLGIALKLYNTVTLWRGQENRPVPMATAASRLFFQAVGIKPFPYSIHVKGEVPHTRGLGSSVTIRLGVITGLNELCRRPLSPEEIVGLATEIEGHPDNAVPAYYGGFAACAGTKFLTTPVAPKLKFIALIPERAIETKMSRGLLPKKIKFQDALDNLQRTSLITAAFCAQNYEALPGLFEDHFHQPYRARLIPGFYPILESARKAGALGGFLSGAGSTLMAVTLKHPQKISAAMLRVARKYKLAARVLILTADNDGVKISRV